MRFKAGLYLLVPFLLLLAMVSCNPNSADLPVIQATPGLVSFFNLIPGGTSINFYVNGTRQNTNKISYEDNSGYMSIVSGQQSIVFKSDSLRTNLFDPFNFTIPADSTSILVTGNAQSNLIFIRDTAVADFSTAGYKPKLRFINAAADAPAYNFSANKVSITNVTYKTVSAFNRVDTGRVVFLLSPNGTGNTILTDTLTLGPNKVYTMFIYGSSKVKNGLTLGIIANH
jgi:hypothetical protein